MEQTSLNDWLGLTAQQMDILKIVYNLEYNRKPTSPKNIIAEYERNYRKKILRPNLFNILKLLINKGIAERKSQSNYTVNFEGIEKNIKTAGTELEERMQEYQQVATNAQEYFRKYATRTDRPQVEYYDHDELYQKMSESLDSADETSIVANFPMIAYTKELLHGLHREQYAEKLWQKSFKEKKLQMNYLTDLNLDALFNHAFRVYGDPKTAYKECETTLNRLETQIKTNPKLDARLLTEPHGLDIAVNKQKNEPTEFYLYIRDEHGDINGGIRIKSKHTAKNANQQFQHNYEYALKLNTPQAQKIIQTLHQTLKQKYGMLDTK